MRSPPGAVTARGKVLLVRPVAVAGAAKENFGLTYDRIVISSLGAMLSFNISIGAKYCVLRDSLADAV